MKIKTIVLLFGVMFLISGCSVTYNLKIAENTLMKVLLLMLILIMYIQLKMIYIMLIWKNIRFYRSRIYVL